MTQRQQSIEDGFYQIILADLDPQTRDYHFIFRIKTWDQNGVQTLAKARRFGSRTYTTIGHIEAGALVRSSVYWEDPAYNDAVWSAAELLIAGENAVREAAGKLYARSFGRCYVCNRLLTVADSLATGIGPDCAGTRRHYEV